MCVCVCVCVCLCVCVLVYSREVHVGVKRNLVQYQSMFVYVLGFVRTCVHTCVCL